MSILFAQPVEQFPTRFAAPSTAKFLSGTIMAAYPATNLLTMDPTQVAMVNSGLAEILIDLGKNRYFDVISLFHSNVGLECSLNITTYVDGGEVLGGTPIDAGTSVDTRRFIAGANPTTTYGYPAGGFYPDSEDASSIYYRLKERNHSFYKHPTMMYARYIKLLIGTNAQTPVSFGRAFIGKSFTPSKGWQYGSSYDFTDTGTFDRTDRGAPVADRGRVLPGATVKMEFLSEAEMMNYIYDFNYWRGSTREMLVCLDTADLVNLQRNLLYCRIANERKVVQDTFKNFNMTWTLESL